MIGKSLFPQVFFFAVFFFCDQALTIVQENI